MNILNSAEDADLMCMISEGNLEALGEVYDRYSRSLFQAALRIVKNRSDAEDLVQDLFEEVRRKSEGYNAQRGKLYTWLLTILKNRAIDRIRMLTRYSNMLSSYNAEVEVTEKFSIEDDDPFGEGGIAKYLSDLSPNHKEVVCLTYEKGMSQREIAGVLGVPVGTVKSRLHFALENLRAKYKAGQSILATFENVVN